MHFYTDNIMPEPDTIFVFGSNPLGINGNPNKGTGGAALYAQQYFGVKSGEKMINRISDSGQAYGIVTVTSPGAKRSLSRNNIINNIKILYSTAESHPELNFKVAYRNLSKKSLNGYTGLEMIDMFLSAGKIPDNIWFSEEWRPTILHNLIYSTINEYIKSNESKELF